MRETHYRFNGGPLDGEQVRKTWPSRPPMYLDVDGTPLRSAVGDRIIVGGRRTGRGPGCYSRVRDSYDSDGRRMVVYRYVEPAPQDAS